MYTMESRKPASLPRESNPGIFLRRVVAPMPSVSRTSVPLASAVRPAMASTGAARSSQAPQVAPAPLRVGPLVSGRGSGIVPQRVERLTAAERRQQEVEDTEDYTDGTSGVNMDDYFRATLSQFQEDSVVANPMNMSFKGTGMDLPPPQTAADALIQQAAQAVKIPIVDHLAPIGHSAIDDKRVYVDTLAMTLANGGFANGEIPLQFADFNGTAPPDRIVKVNLTPFNFPHVYTVGTTVFDMFYFRIVHLTIRFIPTSNQTQTMQPGDTFTFEMVVGDIDSSAVFLTPVEPTFCLGQPVSITGDLTVRFQVRMPGTGALMPIPIPPTRIIARRVSTIAAPPTTTFTLQGGIYIGAIAPPAAIYTVPVLFKQFNPIITALETALINDIGYQTTNFVAPSSFDIALDTTAIPIVAGQEDIYVFVPKNGVSFSMRFSSLQPTKTNDLLPIHS